MTAIGFLKARSLAIRALQAGPKYIQFEDRDARESKNLLDTEELEAEDVVALLRACRGTQYKESPHHRDRSLPVHEFKPVKNGEAWYIKLYFVDLSVDIPPTVFISVHRSNR